MKPSFFARASCVVGTALLLTACEDDVRVNFAQPFPAQSANLPAFPARQQGVYMAADTAKSLCVGRTAVWRQERLSMMLSRHELDSLGVRLRTDSTYRSKEGDLHRLHLTDKDSVRDSWIWRDTIFSLTGTKAGLLRRFRGRYYLNTPNEPPESWHVQRLKIEGRQLVWQRLGQDTLRLRALDAAAVLRRQEQGVPPLQLRPAPGPQSRQVSGYDGLWEDVGEFRRRYRNGPGISRR